jgi:hypothetical protein
MVFVQSKEIFAIAIMLQLSLLSSQAIFATCNGKWSQTQHAIELHNF